MNILESEQAPPSQAAEATLESEKPIAKASAPDILPKTPAERPLRVADRSCRSKQRSLLSERSNQHGPANRGMIANGTWLTAGAVVVDGHGRIVESNEEFAFWAGISPGEPLAITDVLERKCPGWHSQAEALLSANDAFNSSLFEDVSVDPPHFYQLELATHGSTKFLRICRCLPPVQELTEGAWHACFEDEESRRELYARTLRAEGQLRLLSGKWPGVLFNQRPDFTFSFISSRIEEWTGIPVEAWAARPQRFWDVVHEADVSELQSQISRCKAGEAVTTTFRIRHVQTGKVTYILERREAVLSSNGLVLGFDGAWVDVSRQTIAEKRLASAVWKETLGVLTMGLAHDFSNIMAGVYSLSETYQSAMQPEDDLYQGFGLIKRNAMQATQLVQRMLSLYQGKVGQRNYYGANELVNDTLEIARKTVRRLTIKTEFSQEQLPLYIDPIEFRQVLINLTLNAADAMPDGGEICFGTSPHEEMPPAKNVQGIVPRGPVVCIEVRDTGSGIAAEHLPHIFDPFFTTKPFNKGSGLGLYNARLFVEKHGGAITVDSVEDQGTTFQLWLPKANFTESERFQTELVLGRKTVLLLETAGRNLDDAAQCLRENGFYVATVGSERGAIELLHSPDYQFDAILALVNSQSRISLRLFNEIDRLRLPVKTVLQIYGANEDEYDPALLQQADLVIGSNLPGAEIAHKLREVLTKI